MFLKTGKQNGGQTLIEALVALAVAMIVISALAVLTTNSVNNAKYAENKSQATNLLNKTLNEVRVVRDQLGWSVFSTYSFTNTCYKGVDQGTWVLVTPSYTCPVISTFVWSSSCADFVNSPAGTVNFFCRRLELKNGSQADSRTVDVSVAWTDSSGSHVVNGVTDLDKHFE